MLLLTVLFTVVLCLFLYSLRTDKGKHTKYARADYRSTSHAVHQNKTLKSSAENSTPSAA
jgi:hypothetical protein